MGPTLAWLLRLSWGAHVITVMRTTQWEAVTTRLLHLLPCPPHIGATPGGDQAAGHRASFGQRPIHPSGCVAAKTPMIIFMRFVGTLLHTCARAVVVSISIWGELLLRV